MAEMPGLAKALSSICGVLDEPAVLPWALQRFGRTGEALESACGSGPTAAPCLHLVATDYQADMVAVAQRRLPCCGRPVTVQQANVCELPFEDSRLDGVKSFAMLHHVGNWSTALSEA